MRRILTTLLAGATLLLASGELLRGRADAAPQATHVNGASIPLQFYRELFEHVGQLESTKNGQPVSTKVTLTFLNGRWSTTGGDDNSTVEYEVANPTKADVLFSVEGGALKDVVMVFNNPLTIRASGAPEIRRDRLEFAPAQDVGTAGELTPNLGQAVGRHLNISSDPQRLFLGVPFVFSNTSLFLGVSGTQRLRRSMIAAVDYKKDETSPNDPGAKITYENTTFHLSRPAAPAANVPAFDSYVDALVGSSAVLAETSYRLDADSCRDVGGACEYAPTFVGGKLEALNLAVARGRLAGEKITLNLGENTTLSFVNPEPPADQPGSREPRVTFGSDDTGFGVLKADGGLYNGELKDGTRIGLADETLLNVTENAAGGEPSRANLEALRLVTAVGKLADFGFGGANTSLNLGLGEGTLLAAGTAGEIRVRGGSVKFDVGGGRWTNGGVLEVKDAALRDLDVEAAGGQLNVSGGAHVGLVAGSKFKAARLRVDTTLEPNVTGPFGKSTLRVRSDGADRPVEFSEALRVFPAAEAEIVFDEVGTPMKVEVNRPFLTGGYRFTSDFRILNLRQESRADGVTKAVAFTLEQGSADLSLVSKVDATGGALIEVRSFSVEGGAVKDAQLPLGEVGALSASDGRAALRLAGQLVPHAAGALRGSISWENVSTLKGRVKINRETFVNVTQGRFDRAALELTTNAARPVSGAFRKLLLSLADAFVVTLPGVMNITTTSGNVLSAEDDARPFEVTASLPYVKGAYTAALNFSEAAAVNSTALLQAFQGRGRAVLPLVNGADGAIQGSGVTFEGGRRLKTDSGTTLQASVQVSDGELNVPATGPSTFRANLEVRVQPEALGKVTLEHVPVPQVKPKGWFFPGVLFLSLNDFTYRAKMALSDAGMTVEEPVANFIVNAAAPPASSANDALFGEYKDPVKPHKGVKKNEFSGLEELWRNRTEVTEQFGCNQRVHLGKGVNNTFTARPVVGTSGNVITLAFRERSVDVAPGPQVRFVPCDNNPQPGVVANVPALKFAEQLRGHRFAPALSAPSDATAPLNRLVWDYLTVHAVGALNSPGQKITLSLLR